MEGKCEKIIYACMEHVEQALDDYVNFQEVPPQLLKTSEEHKCTYCLKNAEYIIMK
jgi:CxxH/CxxC protein (TIGR04129 family)